MQGDICPGCTATDMGEAVTYTEPFKPRHRWRDVWIVDSEGLPTPSGQPVFPWTLLTGHQPQRRAMSLLPQHWNVDFTLLLYPSLHQHWPKPITSNPFTWQKAEKHELESSLRNCVTEKRRKPEYEVPFTMHGPAHWSEQPNPYFETLSWGYHSLGHNFWTRSRKNMR